MLAVASPLGKLAATAAGVTWLALHYHHSQRDVLQCSSSWWFISDSRNSGKGRGYSDRTEGTEGTEAYFPFILMFTHIQFISILIQLLSNNDLKLTHHEMAGIAASIEAPDIDPNFPTSNVWPNIGHRSADFRPEPRFSVESVRKIRVRNKNTAHCFFCIIKDPVQYQNLLSP